MATSSSPAYNFRIAPEIGWAIATGAIIALAEAAVAFDESVFAGDPGAWAAALAGTLVRAIGGAVLAKMTQGAFLRPGEKPPAPTDG